jgi:Cys-tRNA(Pro) deacylase
MTAASQSASITRMSTDDKIPHKTPMTPATRELLKNKIAFEPHIYDYEERGGTAVSSKKLGVSEHSIVKTLIFEQDDKDPLIVLMHGDKNVSTKELARLIGVKRVAPCHPDTANRHSGYQVGGTSPFGTRKAMPIYMQKTIADLPLIYINGGKKGFLVQISPADLIRVLNPVLVEIATDPS